MILNPTFNHEDIEKEKQVVIQEIKMVEDTPDDIIHDILAMKIWRNHPLGMPILGNRTVIEALTRDEIVQHFASEYHAGKMLISTAGNISHEEICELIWKYLGNAIPGNVTSNNNIPALTPIIESINKPLEQVHFCFGIPCYSYNDNKRFALFVLNDIIGGCVSSRLFQEIREKRGLVYSIFSGASLYKDTGLLFIYGATDPDFLNQVLNLIIKELKSLKYGHISGEELERTKGHLKGSIILGLENVSSHMHNIARSELNYDRYISPDEVISRIISVSSNEVELIANGLFQDNLISLITLGPKNDQNTIVPELII